MPSLYVEKKYVATKDFEKPVTLEFSCEEFRENENTNGLPGVELSRREFVVAEDCSASIRGFTNDFPANKKVKDVRLAYNLIKQGCPLTIRDTLNFKEGDIMSEEIGLAMKEQGHPVKLAPKPKAEADTPDAPEVEADAQVKVKK